MKNAGIKSKAEAAQRLINGEVFYCEGCRVFFDPKQEQPFRYDYAPLNGLWSSYADWETQSDWRDEVSEENPVLCWVSDSAEGGKAAVALVEEYNASKLYSYKETCDEWWKFATPVKPEDCWQEGNK